MKYQPFALGAILREWLCQNDIEPEFPSARRNDGSATAQSGLRTSAAQTPSPEISPEELKKTAPHGITFVRSKSYVM